jgi:hypothetical protein
MIKLVCDALQRGQQGDQRGDEKNRREADQLLDEGGVTVNRKSISRPTF